MFGGMVHHHLAHAEHAREEGRHAPELVLAPVFVGVVVALRAIEAASHEDADLFGHGFVRAFRPGCTAGNGATAACSPRPRCARARPRRTGGCSRCWRESTPSIPPSTWATGRCRKWRRGRDRRSGRSSSRRTPAMRSAHRSPSRVFADRGWPGIRARAAAAGSTPVRSRQTRRRNSESPARSDGTIWNLRSLAKTKSSMKLLRGTCGIVRQPAGRSRRSPALATCPPARTRTAVSPSRLALTTPLPLTAATSPSFTA